ncbi:MAG TPA: sigma-54 dependent transcriptional regulator, partial [Blastocatellia bacterium]|nr:sigma-54 dependent transcriptional regulator [Blastocatellia bacterium]
AVTLNALLPFRAKAEAARGSQETSGSFGMIGSSPLMQEIYDTIAATAQSDASVLIEGESGTGKELIATAFHAQSSRRDFPFVRINCAAIPPDLLESELFGHERGAFTGAHRAKRGLIEAAAGGTILLDEVAEMPTHLQSKLLRVLQEHRVRHVGSEQEINVNFRLVSATNRNSHQAIREGSLREDLYYRLSTIKIAVPPLRERVEDIQPLAKHFLDRYRRTYNKRVRALSGASVNALTRYSWPGNIRELESVIEHAVLFSTGERLMPADLPQQISAVIRPTHNWRVPPHLTLEEIERGAIEQTLERTSGNIRKTAQILAVHRPTLYRKLKRFGLKPS